MNITPQVPNLSIPTVLNPPTESLRRENNQREIITQPAATSQSAAEKGVASERERSRTPAQNNANIDFANISEQAELANTSIAEQDDNQDQENSGDSQETAQEAKEQTRADGSEQQPRTEVQEQERVVNELQRRDKEVRAHELAHSSVGGTYTGPPNYSFQTGPDGKRYVTGGEVSVDLSSIQGNPQATIAKMKIVQAAALAPVNPSVQDTRVASTATQLALQAQSELLLELDSSRNEQQAQSSVQRTAALDTDETLADSGQTGLPPAFDVLINKTLSSQEAIAPSQSVEVIQRSLRIESYYSGITQAYEKPPSNQFELTA
ncbi:MAG: hypothetical protein JKY81_12960 [Colwellia sp.]|nr:hypothetical protein [Colwellia sp.]